MTDQAGLSDSGPTVPGMPDLTDLDRQVLAFERGRWKYAGAKDTAVRDTFGMTATRYYQLLGAIINKPAALEYDPQLVNRLRRLRDTRRQARAEGGGR